MTPKMLCTQRRPLLSSQPVPKGKVPCTRAPSVSPGARGFPRATFPVPPRTGSAGPRRTSRHSSFEMCSQDPKHPGKTRSRCHASCFVVGNSRHSRLRSDGLRFRERCSVVCDACTIECRPLRSNAFVAFLCLFSGL